MKFYSFLRREKKPAFFRVILCAAVIAGMLAACGHPPEGEVSGSSSRGLAASSAGGSSAEEQTEVSPDSGDVSDSSQDGTVSSGEPFHEEVSSGGNSGKAAEAQENVMNQIKTALNTKVPLMLPTGVPVEQNRHLTAKTSSQEADYKVDFYETDQPVEINSQAVSNGMFIATLEAAGYKDAAAAKENVSGYTQINTSDYDEFADLGRQIKAVKQAGMGHQQLLWNEGNWYVHLDYPTDSTLQNQAYPDNMQLAKSVVAYLDQNMMSIPQKIGAITIMNWNTSVKTTVEWQNGAAIYRISSRDPMAALKIAAAMKLK